MTKEVIPELRKDIEQLQKILKDSSHRTLKEKHTNVSTSLYEMCLGGSFSYIHRDCKESVTIFL